MSEILLEVVSSLLGALWPYADSDTDNLHLRAARKIRNHLVIFGVVALIIFATGFGLLLS